MTSTRPPPLCLPDWMKHNSLKDERVLARQQTALEIVKVGFEQFVANAARDYGLLYGARHRVDGAAHGLAGERGV